jgi:hypothetical protein
LAVDTGKLICILPIFDRAFSAGKNKLSDSQVESEMAKLRAQVGENHDNIKVGFSGIFQGRESLERLCRIARENNLSIRVIIAVQTHSGGVPIDGSRDLRQYQWRLDGKTYEGAAPAPVNGVISYAPRDWQTPTPSRYCHSVHTAMEKLVGKNADEIRIVMDKYPGVIVVVNCCIEEELAGNGEATDEQLADYSPFAVAEFRDWLRHTGEYDDAVGKYKHQGAPEAIVGKFIPYHGECTCPFYNDPRPDISSGRRPTFDQTFDVHFTSWSLRSWDLDRFPLRITDPQFTPAPDEGAFGNTPGGFDAPRSRDIANPYWNAWSWDVLDHGDKYPPGNPAHPAFGFRQAEVKHFVSDVMETAAKAGIPKSMLYAHQIPTETVGAARLRSGGDPIWTGLFDDTGSLGITRFGPIDASLVAQYSRNWGIFEWHPAPGAKPDAQGLYDATTRDLNADVKQGAHVFFPGWWQLAGAIEPTFPLNDSNFARALKDWINAQKDSPNP